MGVAIATGAGVFAFPRQQSFRQYRWTKAIGWSNRKLGYAAQQQEYRSLHDFVTWRAELKSVEDVAAFPADEAILITEDGPDGTARVSEITAAGLQAARVAPLLRTY